MKAKINYHPMLDEHNIAELRELFDAFPEKFEDLVISASTPNELPLGAIVEINYACAWNSPLDVGSYAGVVATTEDNMFAAVEMPETSKYKVMIYRSEDLTFTGKIAKFKADESKNTEAQDTP